MAIVHVNGFGTIPVSGDYFTLVNASSGASTWSSSQVGRYGGYALRYSNSTAGPNTNTGRLLVPMPLSGEFSVAFALNHRNAITTGINETVCGFSCTAGTNNLIEVRLGTGFPIVLATPGGTTAWTVTDSSLTSVGWHWWNWLYRYHATNGLCQLYRDGVMIAQTGTDTVPSTSAVAPTSFSFYMGNDNGGAKVDMGDFILRDDATVIPDMAVTSLFPDANSGAPVWVGSDGGVTPNYALVNEAVTYNSGTYVGSATVGATDTYSMANLTNNPASVQAVQVSARAFKSDGGAKTMACVTNGTAGASVDPGGGKTIYQITTTDPLGGSWDKSKVDAMTAGVRVTGP